MWVTSVFVWVGPARVHVHSQTFWSIYKGSQPVATWALLAHRTIHPDYGSPTECNLLKFSLECILLHFMFVPSLIIKHLLFFLLSFSSKLPAISGLTPLLPFIKHAYSWDRGSYSLLNRLQLISVFWVKLLILKKHSHCHCANNQLHLFF